MKKILITAATLGVLAGIAQAEPKKVTAFNFARAESDLYFSNVVKRNGGLNTLLHDRVPPSIAEQTVIRMNRDTLYSSSVHDLAAGPVSISMPEVKDGRFLSLQVISQDHFTPFVIHEGTLELTQENVGTRYAMLVFRTFVDPNSEADIQAAHAAQDATTVTQVGEGSFDVPDWDGESLKIAHEAFAALQSLGGTADKVRMGTADEVDPVAHLMATATGWGLNPRSEAMYFTGYPEGNEAETVQEIFLTDVPVDGFWSISVYNKDGYFEENKFGAYSLNNVTAVKGEDGNTRIQFGGCDGQIVNCIPITDGWNYSLRLYRPKAEVVDGSWQPPKVRKAAKQ